MRMIPVLLILISLAFQLTPLGASEATPDIATVELPAEAQTAMVKFVSAGAQLQKDSDEKKVAVRTKFSQTLEQLQGTESKAGRLDSALAVKTLRESLDADHSIDVSKAILAPSLPKGVVRPAEVYQTDFQKIDKDLAQKINGLKEQAIKELEVVKIAETKAGRLDTALVVKDQQEQLKGGQSAARKGPNKVLVFGKGSKISPVDQGLLRRGCSSSTVEFVLLSVTKDGSLFQCGGGGNGQSVAFMKNELWYAIAGRSGVFLKVPIGAAKPPYHFAVQYSKGTIQVWINGVLAKQDDSGPDEIGDNSPGGTLGEAENQNQQQMPRQGFEGQLIAFRFVDKVVYTAPFTPSYPLPPSENVRFGIDVVHFDLGPVTDIKGAPKLIGSGELTVKAP